jgi:thiol-disulfide isomerase/thioredoxin
MFERLIVAGAVVALLFAAIALVRLALRRRDERLIAQLNDAIVGVPSSAEGTPRVIYFTTRSCIVCRAQQEPALDAVLDRMPELRVEKHDAVEERELASEFGVLSVPTTAVYDRSGELVAINRGFASAAVLHAQLEGRDVEFEGGQAMTGERIDPPPGE